MSLFLISRSALIVISLLFISTAFGKNIVRVRAIVGGVEQNASNVIRIDPSKKLTLILTLLEEDNSKSALSEILTNGCNDEASQQQQNMGDSLYNIYDRVKKMIKGSGTLITFKNNSIIIVLSSNLFKDCIQHMIVFKFFLLMNHSNYPDAQIQLYIQQKPSNYKPRQRSVQQQIRRPQSQY